ncbi:protein of unknown function (DUF4061) [Blomia tropicalis]|nr:protein of unknown function (DUF4061) [Blomia tropicalis]
MSPPIKIKFNDNHDQMQQQFQRLPNPMECNIDINEMSNVGNMGRHPARRIHVRPPIPIVDTDHFGLYTDFKNLPLPMYHPYYKSAAYAFSKEHQEAKEFTDVKQMEITLQDLLHDFHSGKLQAFGEKVTFENMIKIREQQENLAKLHFELNYEQSKKQTSESDITFDQSSSNNGENEHQTSCHHHQHMHHHSMMSKPFSKSNMLKLIHNINNKQLKIFRTNK